MRAEESILFAVVGMSPAVLTETVWALAHEKNPVVPDRIVVLTTTSARSSIEKMLFQADAGGLCGWEKLKQALQNEGLDVAGKLKFGLTGDSLRVFTDSSGQRELADIATSEDNDAAADFMLRNLRGFTSNPATSVIASIAGGRKTMSALMISCMSLLGREQDRVCHVLVNPPYDGPLEPPFLFPIKGLMHRSRDNKKYSSVKALIELTDVPFVRMLGWYEDKFRSAPPRYSALVAGVQRQVPKVYPVITLDMERGTVEIDHQVLDLAPTEFMLLYVLCKYRITKMETVFTHLCTLKAAECKVNLIECYVKFMESSRFSKDDAELVDEVRKTAASLRGKLKSSPAALVCEELIPKRDKSMTYPANKIRIKGELPFAVL